MKPDNYLTKKVAYLVSAILLLPLIFTTVLVQLASKCITVDEKITMQHYIYFQIFFYVACLITTLLYYVVVKRYKARYSDQITEHIIYGFFLLYVIFVSAGVVFVIFGN